MTTPEDEIILEPGDPGYVAPGEAEPEPEPVPEAVPAGQNLEHERLPKESDAEFLARTRATVVRSESPTDIVPNTPQISMSPQAEVLEAEPAPEPEPEPAEEAPQ